MKWLRDLEVKMNKEKILQNIERVYTYVFHTLGCSPEEAKEILEGVIKKRLSLKI